VSDGRVIAAPVMAEASWHRYLRRRGQGARGLDDWVAAGARLVVVAPHPDDEVLACGGLIQAHAARQGAVTVVGVTDGEASHAEVEHASPGALAMQRRHERERGLAALGVSSASVVRLGLADGAVERHAGLLADRLAALLRPGDTVVSTWCLDGHPDHEATGAATAHACSAVGCRFVEAPVWMWHWALPGDARVEWHRLRAFRLDPAAMHGKRAALSAHASQLATRGDALPPVLDDAIVERSRREFEYFFI